MSLNDPLHIDVTHGTSEMDTTTVIGSAAAANGQENSEDDKQPETISQLRNRTETSEKFATPSSLTHYCVVVPNKLRLVTLASFLLEKCKVMS